MPITLTKNEILSDLTRLQMLASYEFGFSMNRRLNRNIKLLSAHRDDIMKEIKEIQDTYGSLNAEMERYVWKNPSDAATVKEEMGILMLETEDIDLKTVTEENFGDTKFKAELVPHWFCPDPEDEPETD